VDCARGGGRGGRGGQRDGGGEQEELICITHNRAGSRIRAKAYRTPGPQSQFGQTPSDLLPSTPGLLLPACASSPASLSAGQRRVAQALAAPCSLGTWISLSDRQRPSAWNHVLLTLLQLIPAPDLSQPHIRSWEEHSHHFVILVCQECYCRPLLARSPRPSDSVHVCLNAPCHLEVNDETDILHIDATSRQISSHKNVCFPRSQRCQGRFPLFLVLSRV
jgi:hypothetical protein